MLRDPDKVRKVIYSLCAWVMVSAVLNIVQRFSGWPWVRTGLAPIESGMSLSTASCLLGISVCILFLARLGK